MDTVKRAVCAAALGLVLAAVSPGAAWAGGGWKGGGGHGGGGHGGGHGGGGHGHHNNGGSKYVFSFGFGPWWGGPGPWWYAPRYYYPYAYGYGYPVYPAPVYAPPRVVVEEPPVYIERDAVPAPPGWWYYCESAGAYYPDTPSCAEPWVKVPPRGQ